MKVTRPSAPSFPQFVFLLGVVLALGYALIAISSIVGGNARRSFEAELHALSMQNDMLRHNLVNKELEWKQKLSENHLPLVESIVTKHESALTAPPSCDPHATRPGVIILGMHRSGTSLVGGLMNKMGLNTGGPLIQAAEDNEKGFFERIDVVLQNDYLMQKQGIHYAFKTHKFDHLQGIKDILTDTGKLFNEGRRGLKFLNNKENYPWMLKDPRLCITLRMWLPFLNFVPAVLYTYRHPLDVALSMNKRETEHFRIARGLRMWYVYNRRAVQQSDDLCRVVSSHRKMMQQPKVELDRIFDELRNSCGVQVPHRLSDKEIEGFIDMKLQHGRSTLVDKSCDVDINTVRPPDSWPTTDEQQIQLYRDCLRAYCALESGLAFSSEFQWNMSILDE